MPTASEREQERERKAQYLADREAETRRLNALIDRRLTDLDKILSAGLSQSALSITMPGRCLSWYLTLAGSIFLTQNQR